MKRLPQDDKLRDALAAEFVLGTLQGAARKRFRRHMRDDNDLRRRVAEWEERLAPLIDAIPERQPPPRVWQKIATRLHFDTPRKAGFWDSLAFWRALGLATSGIATALLVAVLLRPLTLETPTQIARPTPVELVPAYVAVLSDANTQKPVLLVSVVRESNELIVKALAEQVLAQDRALELWALPAKGNPRSLGLVSASGRTTLRLAGGADETLGAIPALAVSLEPSGGSPTGLPTGPVLYSGPFVKTF
jgi:anti-sigma-K factor RskA